MFLKGFKSDESSTVIVGKTPPLEDVLDGSWTEPPFDKASFTAFAKRNLFAESLDFLSEVEELRKIDDGQVFAAELKRIVGEYIREGSISQVNISSHTRKDAEDGCRRVLAVIRKDPSAKPDRTVLDEASKSVVDLVRNDQYARYVNFIVVQRQLRVSRQLALWWKQDGLTARQFFTFPSPVNASESRLHHGLIACLVVLSCSLTYFCGIPWLWLYVDYGFLVRTLCGPRLDPQAFLVLFVLRPLVVDRMGLLKDEFEAGSPKHFSQLCGLCVSIACTTLAFLKLYPALLILSILLTGATTLACVIDFCIACYVYLGAVTLKLVPASWCADCNVRYIKGKGRPSSGKVSPVTSEGSAFLSSTLRPIRGGAADAAAGVAKGDRENTPTPKRPMLGWRRSDSRDPGPVTPETAVDDSNV